MSAQPGTQETRLSEVGATLLPVRREITRERIDAYRHASGDHNPIHHDEQFAAGTQFGGVIAHGMLTLALVSEMMTQNYGSDWLTTGTMKVRFRGAAYPGDLLEATGSVSKSESDDTGVVVTCNVEVRSAHNDSRIITGSASVRVGPSARGETGE